MKPIQRLVEAFFFTVLFMPFIGQASMPVSDIQCDTSIEVARKASFPTRFLLEKDSVYIRDVFLDGFEVSAIFSDISPDGEGMRYAIRFRTLLGERNWIRMADGRWAPVIEGGQLHFLVHEIYGELGNTERRPEYLKQLDTIMDAKLKKEEAEWLRTHGKRHGEKVTEPFKPQLAMGATTPAEEELWKGSLPEEEKDWLVPFGDVKVKGQVQEGPADSTEQVEITFTEAPKVEIISK